MPDRGRSCPCVAIEFDFKSINNFIDTYTFIVAIKSKTLAHEILGIFVQTSLTHVLKMPGLTVCYLIVAAVKY